MNTNALNRLIKELGRDNVLVCSKCGSLNIEYRAWINANYKTFRSDIDADNDESFRWCNDCQKHVKFKSLADFEKKMDEDMSGLKPEQMDESTKKVDWNKLPYLRKREIWTQHYKPLTWPERKKTQKDLNDLSKLRNDEYNTIRSILRKYNLEFISAFDIDEGCTPILREDSIDENMTYTLDKIILDCHGVLSFEGSNCCNNIWLLADNTPTDSLINIANWLSLNEIVLLEKYLELSDDATIDEIEKILKEKGATFVETKEEKLDDASPNDEDFTVTMKTIHFIFGDVGFNGYFCYGDITREIVSKEFSVEAETTSLLNLL